MGTCGLALAFFLAFLSIFSTCMGENLLISYYVPSTFASSSDRNVILKVIA